MNNPVPVIPETAPFTAEQRYWLNGFLAGVFSNQDPNKLAKPATPSKGKITIMYGSQGGNSEEIAESLGEKLSASGFDSPVINMEDYEEVDLTKEEKLVLVSSTWGEGDPPDNAVEFWKYLSDDSMPKLENTSFTVCGLGDTNYIEFCGMGKKFDARLEELGATRVVERADCDVDYEEPSEEWIEKILNLWGAEEASSAQATKKTETGYSKKNPFPATLLKNKKLNHKTSERDTRHFEISLKDSGLEYEVGDALGVVPVNCPEVVDQLLTALGWSDDEELKAKFKTDYAITIPSRKIIEHYNQLVGDKVDADYLWGRELIDLIQDYPEVKFTKEEFVEFLAKLQPRLYSISSSIKAHPEEVHLTVASVTYEAHGKKRKGVCSTYLADRADDEKFGVFVHPSKGFKLPTNPEIPIIMVGPGTGIAPFRAFLEERKELNSQGENWLFFGNPYEKTDYLYQEELENFQKEGFLNQLDLAWSRDGKEKVYVQDLMRKKSDDLWKWIDAGAHFYVCGDAKRMAKDVDLALQEIIEKGANLTAEKASDYLAEMKKNKRYQRDVY